MTALATTYATGHVGLNVADLDRSVDFYARRSSAGQQYVSRLKRYINITMYCS